MEAALALRETRRAALRAELDAVLADRSQLTLEIGCGHGHFLTAFAAAHPAERCVGIDIIPDRLARAARKATRLGLTNVHWVLANAEDFLAELPDRVTLGPRIFILFPDPWPKRRHWKNRLIQPDFLSTLARRSEPGAQLAFRTDHDPYFEVAAAVIAGHPDWMPEPDQADAWPFEETTVFQARAPSYQSLVARRATAAG
jgi:tRNA (guanine-N7-)-methyltransferase